ncbi:putative MFS-type transporter YcaD [Pandoraea pneumonica]|jgi:MFS family permease|uniref:Putative MFS-type transporter YcaD n=1 Tax=Pandoraea pneumonica TaxID=2508299 RepID=A0A5E4VXK1_9BURK|nr:MFS transporter [Pandoraea pneumonica]VVE15994.1 putative MFS-type transporter YcaD [Pandoraea pneumonica]
MQRDPSLETPLPEDEPDRPGPLSEGALLSAPSPAPGPAPADAVPLPISVYPALMGILLAYGVLVVGNGLFATAIPFHALQYGASTFTVGVIQSCYYGGFLLGAFYNRSLIERIGQHRAFVAFAALAALFVMGFAVSETTLVLCLLRLGTGLALMGVYTTVESWLNGSVPNTMRGRVFGSYLTINYLAVGAGQFLLNVGEAGSEGQLLLVAGLFVAAILPITLMQGWPTRVADDRLVKQPAMSLFDGIAEMARATPIAIPGCILAGFLYSAFYAIVPIYLTRIGLSIGSLSTLMGVALFGALLMQWPIGRLSDRMDRRTLSRRLAFASAAFCAPLIVIQAHWLVFLLMFLFSAANFTQYGLIVSHVNDRTAPEQRVVVSATLLILFSVGGILGPVIASLFMTLVGPGGLHIFNVICALLLARVALRAQRLQP